MILLRLWKCIEKFKDSIKNRKWNKMFFNNYSKPGKGVNKRNPEQPRIQVFFDVLPRKLWDLFKLNILYLLVSIPFFIVTMIVVGIVSAPIIDGLANQFDNVSLVHLDLILRIVIAFWFTIILGQGPITAGYTYIIREHGREHPCWIISDFFERFKSNFKQGILLWIIDLAALYLFTVAVRFYGRSGIFVLQYLMILMAVIYAMMHIYVYQMMVTFDLPLKNILRNSLLLALAKAPVSLLILLLNVIIYAVIPIVIILTAKSFVAILILLLTEVLILPPITSFTINFYIDPILDKHINIENKK